MRFCPWYALDAAEIHAPASRGMLQLRVAEGLLDYPTGKSAMIHYELTDDVRAAAARLATRPSPRPLWCRHTVELTAEDSATLAAFHERLVREFLARFGQAPRWPS